MLDHTARSGTLSDRLSTNWEMSVLGFSTMARATNKSSENDKALEETPKESFKPGLGHDRLLKLGGVTVFIASATVGLFFLLIGNFLPIEDWARLRTVELFAMLAAMGIIVAVLASRYNTFSMTFGILLIGALIVPTKDMVSLALLATGKDPWDQSHQNRASDGSEFKGRDSDVAEKIIARLQRTPKEEGGDPSSDETVLEELLDPSARNQAKLAITDTIRSDRKVTHLERIRYSGSLGLLLSFADTESGGGYKEYYYRYGNKTDFFRDLQTLRSQELIRFSYDDFTEATITFLGKEVVCDYFETFESEICPFDDVTSERRDISRLLSDFSLLGRMDREAIQLCENSWDTFSELSVPINLERRVNIPHGARFTVTNEANNNPDGAVLLAQLLQINDSGDPYLSLLSRDINGNCSILNSNDDRAVGDFSSEISWTLGTGTFAIVALDLRGDRVQHNLTISFPRSPIQTGDVTPQ